MTGDAGAGLSLPPPLPRSGADLLFDFIAEDRQGGRVPSLLTISPPTLIPGARDWYCTFTFSGFDDRARNAYGATGLQALEHATKISRLLLATHEREWTFWFSDEGPMDFTELNALDPPVPG